MLYIELEECTHNFHQSKEICLCLVSTHCYQPTKQFRFKIEKRKISMQKEKKN